MIKSEETWSKLYEAAETIYKFCDPNLGFKAGVKQREDGSKVQRYNQYSGAKIYLEKKLNRKLTIYEQVVLAIAVGDHVQSCLCKVLTIQERNDIFQDLWNNESNRDHVCLTFDRLVTCI